MNNYCNYKLFYFYISKYFTFLNPKKSKKPKKPHKKRGKITFYND